MDPTPPPPLSSPKQRSKRSAGVEDLPLFAKRMPPPMVPTPAAVKQAAGSRKKSAQASARKLENAPEVFAWRRGGTWLPVIALGMVIAGVWLLVPWDFSVRVAPDVDRSLPTVVIDAGHGGRDSGAISNGLREKDLTLDTALRLEQYLRNAGFGVVLTRRDDRFFELFERAQVANQIRRALFVSIHFNDNTTSSGDGVETFYAQQKAAFSGDGWSLAGLFEGEGEAPPLDQGESFARAIQASMVTQLGVTDRGAKPRQLAVVRLTRCPAVLVEGGFLNNAAEARKLATPEYRERLAAAVADGITAYIQQKTAEQRDARVAGR